MKRSTPQVSHAAYTCFVLCNSCRRTKTRGTTSVASSARRDPCRAPELISQMRAAPVAERVVTDWAPGTSATADNTATLESNAGFNPHFAGTSRQGKAQVDVTSREEASRGTGPVNTPGAPFEGEQSLTVARPSASPNPFALSCNVMTPCSHGWSEPNQDRRVLGVARKSIQLLAQSTHSKVSTNFATWSFLRISCFSSDLLSILAWRSLSTNTSLCRNLKAKRRVAAFRQLGNAVRAVRD